MSAPDWLTKARSPRLRRDMREARVEPDPRHHDADAIRPDDAQEMGLRRLERLLLQRAAALAKLAEAGGDHHRGARAAGAELGEQAGHGIGRRGDDGEVGRLRQMRDVGIDGKARRSCRGAD